MRLALSLFTSFTLLAQTPVPPSPLRGYSPTASSTELEWERKFRDLPTTDHLRENMRRLAAHPHHVGSPYDKNNAEWILAQLKSWGLDAKIEVFDTLYPTPKTRLVELISPTRYTAKLHEPTLAQDPTSSQHNEQLPTFNMFSIDGDVTAPLVYINFGTVTDYEELDRLGISVKGAIVIARYGSSWRGSKPKIAAEHGAVGCLIYSDPHEDGFAVDDTYPAGPMRPRSGVQRGSVLDMPVFPGDPQTPGVGATPGAKLIPLNEVTTLTKIPVMPLSSEDAEPLLQAIAGQPVPAAWRGSLPITYHLGPGPAKVHLLVRFNWDRKPLYNVIAKIPGSEFPDEWIMRGNHHDAWVNGASDPVSGASPALEEARALGELLKAGWKPRRTILYCFWDGEEAGLLGSTEWGETHAAELQQHAVAYLNSDTNGRGIFAISGSHSLEAFANSVMKDIADPEAGMTVWNRANLSSLKDRTPEQKLHSDLPIEAPGSGSDYTVFIDHLGIASLNFGFGGEDADYAQYHSIYDDFNWYTKFIDPGFVYGRLLAQTAGTMMLRLAGAEMLPFQFTNLAYTIHRYVSEVEHLAATARTLAEQRNQDIEAGLYRATLDPHRPIPIPASEPVPPFLNFAPLDNASEALTLASAAFEKALAQTGTRPNPSLNPTLIQTERVLSDRAGLPGRPWFQNLVYAPGLYTGYGVKTLPGIREAIEQKKWDEAERQIPRVAKALNDEAHLIESATQQLQGGVR